MLARTHGESTRRGAAAVPPSAVAFAVDEAPSPPFGFMFAGLAEDPANRLPEGAGTIAALRELGAAMAEDPSSEEGVIPAAYTYFGQFIDHDITKTMLHESIGMAGGLDIIEIPSFAPLNTTQVAALITNARSAPLDLDSVYGGVAEREATLPDGRMLLGVVSPAPFGTIPTADRNHDLPRRPMIPNPQTIPEKVADREALIGDPRNDENLLVGQLHVAFLRAHNKLVERFQDPVVARRELRRRYQWAVLHDFLRRIGAPAVVSDVLENGPRFFRSASADALFMPLEFSGAAYRFGHSMIRQQYSHNATFNPSGIPATFNFMFTFTALSGNISPNAGAGPAESPTLPDNWIIDWSRFFEDAAGTPGLNPTRRIDTRMAPELGQLPDLIGVPVKALMGQLASRNLLRGYLLGLPTGQAVAARIGVAPLARNIILEGVPAAKRERFEASGLADRTPLWFYVLAEAGARGGPDGKHLGEVGTRIVAETLWNLALHATDSVIKKPPSEDEQKSPEFTLRGIVNLGLDARLPSL